MNLTAPYEIFHSDGLDLHLLITPCRAKEDNTDFFDTLGPGDHVVPEATNTCSPPTEQFVAVYVEGDRQEEKTLSSWVSL